VVYYDAEFVMEHPTNMGNVVLQDYYGRGWTAMGGTPNTASPCVASNGTWHLMLVWGHGLPHYEGIVDSIHDSVPSAWIAFQKVVSIKSVDDLVTEVYSDDVARVGGSHIASKTGYLQSVAAEVGVLVVYDPFPDFQEYGEEKWAITANKHLVDLKWAVRQRFNPKLQPNAKRDSKGLYSHNHVVHVSDSASGVDEILLFLGLHATTSYLRSHTEIATPWFLPPPRTYGVERVRLDSLRIGCAVSIGKCRAGENVAVGDSPHYAFATGNQALYADYYREGRVKGYLTDDHTPKAFQRLQSQFVPDEYPSCVCGFDGIERRSMILVNEHNRVLEGAHRAALLMTADHEEEVEVVRVGVSGQRVADCAVSMLDTDTRRPLNMMETPTPSSPPPSFSSVLDSFQSLDDFGVQYVVLRGQPLQREAAHPDIDVLVANYAQACAVLTNHLCPPRDVRMQGIRLREAYFDVRTIGDHYYPSKWAEQMLRRRVRAGDGLYHLHDEDQYYALLYHAVIHKGKIGAGYLQICQSLLSDCALTADIATWSTCLQKWMLGRFEFSETCHNCGESFLAEVGLANTCGDCENSAVPKGDSLLDYQATVVTAFFATGTGKHSRALYRTWMQNTLAIGDPLVMFTDSSSLASEIREFRSHAMNRTLIVPTTLVSAEFYHEFGGKAFWESQLLSDSEEALHRDWRLYVVWGEKSNWLFTVAKKNPFSTKHFVWIDCGYIRTPQFRRAHSRMVQRPLDATDDRTILFNIHPIGNSCQHELDTTGRIYFGKISKDSCHAARTNAVNASVVLRPAGGFIGGGGFLGTRAAVERWHHRFIQVTHEYAKIGIFAGKEQYQMASIAVQWPHEVRVIQPHRMVDYAKHFGDPWFAMVPFLSGLFEPTEAQHSLWFLTRRRIALDHPLSASSPEDLDEPAAPPNPVHVAEPDDVDRFWEQNSDRVFMTAFYPRLSAFHTVLDIGARAYNARCKSLISSVSTQYLQLEPHPPSIMVNDGLLKTTVGASTSTYPEYRGFFDVVVDFGVLGWGSIELSSQDIHEYVDNVYTLLADGGMWALKVDKSGVERLDIATMIEPFFEGRDFDEFNHGQTVSQKDARVFFWFKKAPYLQFLNRTTLVVVCHPDDESIFASEFLGLGSHVVVVTDANSAGKAARRRRALAKAMALVNTTWEMWDIPETKDHSIKNTKGWDTKTHESLTERLVATLQSRQWREVVTHNAWGECGHVDHRNLHRAAVEAFREAYGCTTRWICADASASLRVFAPVLDYVERDDRLAHPPALCAETPRHSALLSVYERDGCLGNARLFRSLCFNVTTLYKSSWGVELDQSFVVPNSLDASAHHSPFRIFVNGEPEVPNDKAATFDLIISNAINTAGPDNNMFFLPLNTVKSLKVDKSKRDNLAIHRPIDVLYRSSRCDGERERCVGVVRKAIEKAGLRFEYSGNCSAGSTKKRFRVQQEHEEIYLAKMMIAHSRIVGKNASNYQALDEKLAIPIFFGAIPLYKGTGQMLAKEQRFPPSSSWLDRRDFAGDDSFAQAIVALAKHTHTIDLMRKKAAGKLPTRMNCDAIHTFLESHPPRFARRLLENKHEVLRVHFVNAKAQSAKKWAGEGSVWIQMQQCIFGSNVTFHGECYGREPCGQADIIMSQCCWGE